VLSFGYFSFAQAKKSDWHVGPPPTVLTLKLKLENKNPEYNDTIR